MSFLKKVSRFIFHNFEAIYNSVKFTDSVFSPDEEYLTGYSEVYKAFLQNEQNANQDKGVQDVIRNIQQREQFLPGTVPSIKSLIIDVIKNKQQTGQEFVQLQDIYKELEKVVAEKILIIKWTPLETLFEVN